MQKIERLDFPLVLEKLEHNPVVALLGARQVGKTTLAKEVVARKKNAVYLDLELDSDRLKVERDPEDFFELNRGKLVCLDEVQWLPEVFRTLRGIVDRSGKNGQFLVLGSASRDLIRQRGETLAGRISYLEISPFLWSETGGKTGFEDHWVRGGYPKSVLGGSDRLSLEWREDYIRSFLERDLALLDKRISSTVLRRFWSMLAHSQGQVLNQARLAASLGVTGPTVKHYIDILEQTFMVRVLPPWFSNAKKRLVKSPKVYIGDTGLLHAILKIGNLEDLLGHPVAGGSFETMVIENIVKAHPRHDPFFFRDSSGNEIDLVLKKGRETIAVEIKLSTAPVPGDGFRKAVKFLKPRRKYLVSRVGTPRKERDGLWITNLDDFLTRFTTSR